MDMLYTYVATSLDRDFSIFTLAAWVHTEGSVGMAKHAIGLKLGGRLVLW